MCSMVLFYHLLVAQERSGNGAALGTLCGERVNFLSTLYGFPKLPKQALCSKIH